MVKWHRFRYYPVLPLGEDGKIITGCQEHIALSREAAAEGMVLLKNEKNLLPLQKNTKVALFGKASVDYVKGGGGILWSASGEKGWGYGNAPKTVEEFADRYVGLTGVLLENPKICGFCYTQLYDVEQEKNGLYTYHREKKFSQEIYDRLKDAMKAKAVIEK